MMKNYEIIGYGIREYPNLRKHNGSTTNHKAFINLAQRIADKQIFYLGQRVSITAYDELGRYIECTAVITSFEDLEDELIINLREKKSGRETCRRILEIDPIE